MRAEKELEIYFCGTGANQILSKHVDYERSDDKTANTDTLCFKGCEHPSVCNSMPFPDVIALTQKIANALVVTKGPGFTLCQANEVVDKLTEAGLECSAVAHLGAEFDDYDNDDAAAFEQKTTDDAAPYTKIRLMGYSRGAVSAFLMAKALHTAGVRLPVEIEALEPVPGNAFEWGLAKAAVELQDCASITKARVEFGAYVKKPFTTFFKNLIHRLFFKQLMPQFHPNTLVSVQIDKRKYDHWSAGYHIKLKAKKLLRVFGKLSALVQFSLAHKSQKMAPIPTAPLDPDEVTLRNELVMLCIELQQSTSWIYGANLFRSCRKEDYLQIMEYDLRRMPAISAEDAREKLNEILDTVFIQRGYGHSTTSGLKAIQALRHNMKYANLNCLLGDEQIAELDDRMRPAHKEKYYQRRLEITTHTPKIFSEYFDAILYQFITTPSSRHELLKDLPLNAQEHVCKAIARKPTDAFATLDYALCQLGVSHLAGNIQEIVLAQTSNHIEIGKGWLQTIARKGLRDPYIQEEYPNLYELLKKCSSLCQKPKPQPWENPAAQYQELLHCQAELRAAYKKGHLTAVRIHWDDNAFKEWPNSIRMEPATNTTPIATQQTPPLPEPLTNYLLVVTQLFTAIKYTLEQCSPEQRRKYLTVLDRLKKDTSLMDPSESNIATRIQAHRRHMLKCLDASQFTDRSDAGKIARYAYYVFEAIIVIPLLIRMVSHCVIMQQRYGKKMYDANWYGTFYGTKTQCAITMCQNDVRAAAPAA